MIREEFDIAVDYFASVMQLPKIAGEAKKFLFRRFEDLTAAEYTDVFNRMVESWDKNYFPKPADFAVHIADATAHRKTVTAHNFEIPEHERPTADDWDKFEKAVSALSASHSIPDEEPEYDPVAAIERWEKNREEVHSAIRHFEKIKNIC